MTSQLDPLFAPSSIAVVGASTRTSRPGYAVLAGLRRLDYGGSVTPVTPSYERVLDWDCVPAITDLSDPVDLVVLAGSADRIESELVASVEAGARAAYIVGRASDPDRIVAIARDAGVPFLGGASMGFVNYGARVSATWGPPVSTRTGSIAVIAQSGTIFLEASTGDPRLSLCFTAHPGQESGVDVGSLIEYAISLPDTRVVGLYLETVVDAESLERALAKADQSGIPVVAIRPGRTQRSEAALATHAGRLSGGHAAFEALFRRYGVTLAPSMDHFWTTLACLSHAQPLSAGRLAALTDSGGERALLLDHADEIGIEFAELSDDSSRELATHLGPGLEASNPVDIWDGHADMRTHTADCLRAVTADPAVSGVLVFCAYGMSDVDEDSHAGAIADGCLAAASETDKPIYAAAYSSRQLEKDVMLRLAESGIPVLDGMPVALEAFRCAEAHRDRVPHIAVAPPTGVSVDLDGDQLDVIRRLGLPAVQVVHVASEEAAVQAAVDLGFPVVLKTAEPIEHKTESDGVRVDLRDERAVREAYADVAGRLGSAVAISPHVRGDVELALGMAHGRFGPMIVVAAGGTLVEVLDDRRWLLAPASPDDVETALRELRIFPVLEGVRGRPPCDIKGFCQMASMFSMAVWNMADHVSEIDLNPVIVGPDGCTIVDALIVPTSEEQDG